jgi:hypothetical protein
MLELYNLSVKMSWTQPKILGDIYYSTQNCLVQAQNYLVQAQNTKVLNTDDD